MPTDKPPRTFLGALIGVPLAILSWLAAPLVWLAAHVTHLFGGRK